MITVRLTDGKSFAIPFSCENFVALRHGCRVAFKRVVAANYERHMKSSIKLKTALREIDEWLEMQLAKPGRSELDIFSLRGTATCRRHRVQSGCFRENSWAKDPDFYLLPDSLQLHVLDTANGRPVDPAGKEGYWIATGDYRTPGSKFDGRCGSNVIVWRQKISDSTFYTDNHITLGSPLSDWERIWEKCIAADRHSRELSMLCQWVAEEAVREPPPRPHNPNRAKFHIVKGGQHGR